MMNKTLKNSIYQVRNKLCLTSLRLQKYAFRVRQEAGRNGNLISFNIRNEASVVHSLTEGEIAEIILNYSSRDNSDDEDVLLQKVSIDDIESIRNRARNHISL